MHAGPCAVKPRGGRAAAIRGRASRWPCAGDERPRSNARLRGIFAGMVGRLALLGLVLLPACGGSRLSEDEAVALMRSMATGMDIGAGLAAGMALSEPYVDECPRGGTVTHSDAEYGEGLDKYNFTSTFDACDDGRLVLTGSVVYYNEPREGGGYITRYAGDLDVDGEFSGSCEFDLTNKLGVVDGPMFERTGEVCGYKASDFPLTPVPPL